jgi:2',3'-cyclic-nucleotide 2'-phosphodiesterase (5'-nucleotidase family)
MAVRWLLPGLFLLVTTTSCQQQTLTILHTNDMHASFIPHEAGWVRSAPKPMVGGFVELTAAVDSLRALHPGALLLDAGDVMTGNPICDIPFGGAQGGLLFDMMNRIGYDVWCPGNHDFDISQENLKHLIAVAHFPAVSANLVNDRNERTFGNRDYVILERAGLRIGIIGIISQQLYSLVNQNNLTGVRVLSPVETVQRLVKELDPRTDLIIALTHQGVDDDSVMAEEVTGLDLIIGGHSHTRLREPKVVHGVVIAQAGSNCENLGILELTVSDDRIVAHHGSLLQLWSRDGKRITRLSGVVDSARTEIDREYSEVIAELKEDWRRGDGESNVANFVLEAQRAAAGAEVSFLNTAGLRRDVPAGPLTKRALYEVLPFRNVLVTFQLSGRQLREVMMYFLTKKPGIQMSGVTCRWRALPGGGVELLELNVQGKPVNDATTYPCAASDYFVGEAIRYLGMPLDRPVFFQKTLFDIALEAARKGQHLTSPIENRIQEVR